MIQKISGNSKEKAQKIVSRIESGKFDEIDVDSLLMLLRAFSNDHLIFREISDFVAHNDERKKGITTNSLEAFYLNLKYFIEYVSKKKELLEEFAANLTPEEQDRAKSKLANKLKSIKEITKSTHVE